MSGDIKEHTSITSIIFFAEPFSFILWYEKAANCNQLTA